MTEKDGDPEQVAHEWELENDVIRDKSSVTQATLCATYARRFG
jgi:hypothetical protein